MVNVPLNNPLRPVILAAARSAKLERTVARSGLTRKLVTRFVPGEAEPAVVEAVSALLGSGRFVSVDYLGEDTTDEKQAGVTVQAYLSLLKAYAGLNVSEVAGVEPLEVSVKLSALGLALPEVGRQVALGHLRTICLAAYAVGAWVTVDAEDAAGTEVRLEVVRQLRQEFPSLGTVLQSYLHRTEQDCRDLCGPQSRIRLCKGAYAEPASVAYQKPADVDDSYRRCLEILMHGEGYPMVASHDPKMITAAEEYAAATDRGRDDFELQMLYGIRSEEQRRLAGAGRRVRVYVPYGDQWYGYFMRRLAERPANLVFFVRSLVSTR